VCGEPSDTERDVDAGGGDGDDDEEDARRSGPVGACVRASLSLSLSLFVADRPISRL
jgi:hypothetical protein